MRKRKVLSEAAYYDIDSMFVYIFQDSQQTAEKLRLRIYNGIKKLSDSPEMGPVIPAEEAPGAQRGYRHIVINPYIVFYRVLEDRIVIARVLHGRQNWLQSLFGISDEV
ncbi:type II toxin-antitoxin system RelE/ParE family toxin [Pelotomaculum propionicicum]|uniref:Toxin RelE4 n=1 Tax=Pelotomaculum propionicicum TaxID=258475 RepID=A0A4Y7RPM1_9FIRM|nr:type II toxin-antitoxin system RelE/ParE family toxin [Pelotomaculum propionicicum]NLI11652.1 type II toxin-antitoxin system RelE/ParE family toxin [Peptococcaceae bacterium]TEB10791.1 Toxin RelE4 [Pelotomaculum propionicicum]